MKTLLLSLLSILTFSASSQYVNIPDANFKSYLLAVPALNTVNDGEIHALEAANFNGSLNIASLGITDLTGIEAFIGNISLNVAGNGLTTLDLSANTGLTGHLYVNGNQLTSLILPVAPNLTQLTCSSNLLTSLDLSNTPNITTMWCLSNNFTSIDFSNSANLIGMNIDGNNMTTIDLSNLVNLQWLSVSQSTLTAIDISPCVSLINFYCNYSDELTELNMANGNNMNFPPDFFSALECPNLTCITVDNVAFANAVWATEVDPGVQFSLDCSSATILATSLSIEGQGGVSTISTPNGTLQMVANVLPIAAQGQNIFWGIAVGGTLATIDANGLITANDNGVITIGALTSDGSNISANANITISNQVAGLETLMDEKMTIYPNPAISDVFIQTTEEIESIKIFAMNGELIQTENTPSFSVAYLSKGVYTIVMQTTQGVSTSRFIKQ